MYGDYLQHYGVPGMQWGKRNYQYEDGSLTPAGREHYGVGPAREGSSSSGGATATVRVKKAEPDRAEIKAQQKKAKEEEAEKQKAAKAAQTKADVIKSGDYNTILKYKSQLTDAELKQALDRMALEKNLAAYAPKTPEKKKTLAESGKKIVGEVGKEVGGGLLKGVGKAGTVIGGAVAVYYGQKLVEKMVGDKDVASSIFNVDIMKTLNTNLGQKLK